VREPKLVVVLPTRELAFSLFQQLSAFPGEKSIAVDIERGYFAVQLVDFPQKPADLDRVIAEIRSWLAETKLARVTVESRWQVNNPSRRGVRSAVRRVLSWKFEDGPADAGPGGSPVDAGPAWLITTDSEGEEVAEPIAGGEWITRAEGRRLAAERGYDLDEDS
jgi:hypothetical protein